MIPPRTKIIGFFTEVVLIVLLLVVPWPEMMGRTTVNYQACIGERFISQEIVPEKMSFRDQPKQIELDSNVLLYGDTLFLEIYNVNLSPIDIPDFPYNGPVGLKAVVRLERYPLDLYGNITKLERSTPLVPPVFGYKSTQSVFQTVVLDDQPVNQAGLRILFNSQEKLLLRNLQIPLPCLPDHSTPFWTQLRWDIRKKPIPLNFQLTFYEQDRHGPVYHFETTIVLKSRPRKQMRQFSQWSGSICESSRCLDENETLGTTPLWYQMPRCPEHYIDIELIKGSYPPMSFTPTTLKGWERLENSISPSTLRDEIHLSRLRFEYYTTSGLQKDVAEQQILNLLDQLPPSRAASMLLGINPYYCVGNNTRTSSELQAQHIHLLNQTKKYQLQLYEGFTDQQMEKNFREKKILCF